MFGSKRRFRQTYRDIKGGSGSGSGSNNSSPTEQGSSQNNARGFSTTSSNFKPKPSMLRIRSAFRNKGNHKKLSPRNQAHSPLAISTESLSPRGAKNHNAARESPLSPVGEQKLRMMPKIAAYRTKGYLTASQERDLFSQLQQKQDNPFDNSAVAEVDKQLEIFKSVSFSATFDDQDNRDNDNTKKKATLPALKSDKPSRATTVPKDQKQFLRALLQKENARTATTRQQKQFEEENNNSKNNHMIEMTSKTSFFDQKQQTSLFDQAEEEQEKNEKQEESFEEPPPDRPYNEIPLNDRVILSSADVFEKLDEKFVENLFIETCFFARLGFLQPPTCLRCLYMEAMEGMDQDVDCQNWVVWRQDGNVMLHPQSMEDNLRVVQCQAARRLVEGEEVQDHYWDTIKRQMMQKKR